MTDTDSSARSAQACVRTEVLEDGILAVILDNPRKKNAISAPMMDELRHHLESAERDATVRVVLLRGAGEHFSSGGDLDQSAGQVPTVETGRSQLRRYLDVVRTIRAMGTPVVAMADGYVVGGGFSLLLACDLVCVSERVKVLPAFCSIGIVPEMGAMFLLPALIGDKRAKEILLTSAPLSADELLGLGLVNRVLTPADLLQGTMALARAVAAAPPVSAQITKGIMNSAYDDGLENVLQAEATASPFCAQTEGFREATARFRS